MIDLKKIYHMGIACGYSAYASCVTVTNPYVPGSLSYQHWSDGYELGALLARDDEMGAAANDNWRLDLLKAFEEAS